jgi:hypothetical protein
MPALLFHAYQQEAEGRESNLYCYEKLRGGRSMAFRENTSRQS